MLRRACFSLIAAFLPLALFLGAPASVAGGAQATTIECTAAGATSLASGPLQQEKARSAWSDWADEDDESDRVLWTGSIVGWPRFMLVPGPMSPAARIRPAPFLPAVPQQPE